MGTKVESMRMTSSSGLGVGVGVAAVPGAVFFPSVGLYAPVGFGEGFAAGTTLSGGLTRPDWAETEKAITRMSSGLQRMVNKNFDYQPGEFFA